MRLENKTVWITGASSGIGEGLAYLLSKRNCKLILSSRTEVELQRVKAGCKHPEAVFILPLDLADFDGMAKKTKQAIAAFGPIDMLLNNAGISQRSLLINTDFAVYKRLIDINYLGTVALTKAVLPHFVSNKKGWPKPTFLCINSLTVRKQESYFRTLQSCLHAEVLSRYCLNHLANNDDGTHRFQTSTLSRLLALSSLQGQLQPAHLRLLQQTGRSRQLLAQLSVLVPFGC